MSDLPGWGPPAAARSRFRVPKPPSREVAVLSAVAFSVAVGFGLVAPVITRFAKSFGVGKFAAGAVLSVFALMRLVSALGCGRLVNRIGERLVLALGIGIVGVSSALAGASQSYAQLLVLRGLGGVGSAMFSVSAMSIVLRSTPAEQRGRAVGLFSGSFLLGGIGGPALGSTVAHLGFRMPFFIYAGTLIVAGSIGLGLLPRAPLVDAPLAPGAPAGTTLWEALRSRAYRAALVANLSDNWAALGVRNALVPLFVVDVLRLPDNWIYVGFFIVAGVNAAVLYPAGRWADERGRKPVLLAGLVLSALAMALLAAVPETAAYVVAMALFGLGSGLLDVAPAAVVGDIAHGRSGTTVAAYQMAGDAGSVLGPLAAGGLADTVSYGAAFGLTSGVLGAAALLALVAPETRRTH
ncbi:MAG TPA: MFS transporter [Mycobacteriales bacterium]|jgi:MFS family permease|nr:MFS transporter [Mycobacteriales bacterium]